MNRIQFSSKAETGVIIFFFILETRDRYITPRVLATTTEKRLTPLPIRNPLHRESFIFRIRFPAVNQLHYVRSLFTRRRRTERD